MWCWKCTFLSWSFEEFKKCTEFRKGLQFDQQKLFKVNVLTGDVTYLNQLYQFDRAASGWSSESFAGGNGKPAGRMEKTKRTQLNNLDPKRGERIFASTRI